MTLETLTKISRSTRKALATAGLASALSGIGGCFLFNSDNVAPITHPPITTMVTPVADTTYYLVGGIAPITGQSYDPDSTQTRVEIYRNGQFFELIAPRDVARFNTQFENLPLGTTIADILAIDGNDDSTLTQRTLIAVPAPQAVVTISPNPAVELTPGLGPNQTAMCSSTIPGVNQYAVAAFHLTGGPTSTPVNVSGATPVQATRRNPVGNTPYICTLTLANGMTTADTLDAVVTPVVLPVATVSAPYGFNGQTTPINVSIVQGSYPATISRIQLNGATIRQNIGALALDTLLARGQYIRTVDLVDIQGFMNSQTDTLTIGNPLVPVLSVAPGTVTPGQQVTANFGITDVDNMFRFLPANSVALSLDRGDATLPLISIPVANALGAINSSYSYPTIGVKPVAGMLDVPRADGRVSRTYARDSVRVQ